MVSLSCFEHMSNIDLYEKNFPSKIHIYSGQIQGVSKKMHTYWNKFYFFSEFPSSFLFWLDLFTYTCHNKKNASNMFKNMLKHPNAIIFKK